MRDADTPPQEPADRSHNSALTPRARAALIRAAAAEVYERVQEWRNSPGWQDTPSNAHRHQATVSAIVRLNVLSEPVTADDLARVLEAVRPVLLEWRPSRPGPEQQIFIAVERLRRSCRH
ncbi:hypothetical protein ABZ738_05315 [Micromonospora sp. NPDC047793]|uniref:hypothetical protein n=1 Tax=Micromonospora sp. NPDC047793 TaxID=3154342 RepID=UPI0033EDBAB7